MKMMSGTGTSMFLCLLVVAPLTLSECPSGTYGQHCKKSCSRQCESFPRGHIYCHEITGGCAEGCIRGFYGIVCNLTCSKNCLHHTCFQHNGHCTQGCNNSFCGDRCDKKCKIDEIKDHQCRNCDVCNRSTGICEQCREGYGGDDCQFSCQNCFGVCKSDCDGGCLPGYFGQFCFEKCSKNCSPNFDICGVGGNSCTPQCHKESGNCSFHCQEGWYGGHCTYKCPFQCKHRRCFSDGECKDGCTLGFYGPYCTRSCQSCYMKRCNITTGQCTKEINETTSKGNQLEDVTLSAKQTYIIVVVCSGLSTVFVVTIVLAVLFCFRRNSSTTSMRDRITIPQPNNELEIAEDYEMDHDYWEISEADLEESATPTLGSIEIRERRPSVSVINSVYEPLDRHLNTSDDFNDANVIHTDDNEIEIRYLNPVVQ